MALIIVGVKASVFIKIDEYEAGRLEEAKQALHELQSFISGIASMFKSGDLFIRNDNSEMLEGMPVYNDIMERNK